MANSSHSPANKLGRRGENRACLYLRLHFWQIIARNIRRAHGEIDIVARRGSTYAFIEVKTRNTENYGRPADAVNAQKQRRIRSAAESLIHEMGWEEKHIRYDIIEVLPKEIRHIKGAF